MRRSPVSILGLTLAVIAGGFTLSAHLTGRARPIYDGPFGVGISHLDLVHMAKRGNGEPLSRRIAVDIWYPAAPPTGGSRVRASLGFSAINLGRPDAAENAPFVDDASRHPLLLYIPSWSGSRSENMFLLSSLASHGYVVAAMDYPDGEVLNPAASDIPTPADLSAPMEFSSEAAFVRTLERAEMRVRSQAKDAIFVLDQLTAMRPGNGGSAFSGRLDRTTIGIIGYSFGGAVAFQAAWLDPRIRAVVNMDGWMFGDAARAGFPAPRLYISDDSALPPATDLQSHDAPTRFWAQLNLDDDRRSRDQLSRYGGYRLQIAGTRHANFSDRPLLTAFPRLAGAGPIDPARAMFITGRFAAAFFDETLKDRPALVSAIRQAEMPEAYIEAWPRPIARPSAASLQ